MFKGNGHRNFLGQVKFDNYFLDAVNKYFEENETPFDDANPLSESNLSPNFELKRSKANTILA